MVTLHQSPPNSTSQTNQTLSSVSCVAKNLLAFKCATGVNGARTPFLDAPDFTPYGTEWAVRQDQWQQTSSLNIEPVNWESQNRIVSHRFQ